MNPDIFNDPELRRTYLLQKQPVWILHYGFDVPKWVVNHLIRAGCKTVADVRKLLTETDYWKQIRNYGIKSHEKVAAALERYDETMEQP
jgi:hypothetical protein